MIAALISGLAVAGMGVLISLAAGNWMISLILSGTAGLISAIFASILRNASLVLGRGKQPKKIEELRSMEEAEKWVGAVTLFSIPNIVVAVILYFRFYHGRLF